MQLGSNTTGMASGLCVATDKFGQDRCVVVVKGTFALGTGEGARLAEVQDPLVYADVHRGEPGTTSLQYECDFAPFKPRADILVLGQAVSLTGRPVDSWVVTLEYEALRKSIRVTGDRRWERGLLGLSPSPPEPFVQMPLVYERAFGGTDLTHSDPRYQGAELRNPVGMGYRKNPDARATEGTPLPNLEDPRQPLSSWKDIPQPMGFGPIGRSWQPRIAHAGTYDQRWQEEDYPFLPRDFDTQYFLCAPVDQQVPYPQGGETFRCTGMTRNGVLVARVPTLRFPITFRFDDRDQSLEPVLDTLLVEPDHHRMMLTWRASVPLGRKPGKLREILVGHQPVRLPPGRGGGKRHFKSLAEVVATYRRSQRKGLQ
ncbi:DUF2169 family type VI secretion system accessory protein [Cystobacter ferrugineus]|uniref:DUF2169 domain-containing protein n=1 Tax=Cystobacter ferrugineus TaxID=83449 RepID=A0A1L9AUS1_9BACT|nr:DUF2169 domain-containing protein [Cystobacter ferrugineus]OJH33683.1 hypothetical protein BON30_47455 [Cystobacter ferrugineus]